MIVEWSEQAASNYAGYCVIKIGNYDNNGA